MRHHRRRDTRRHRSRIVAGFAVGVVLGGALVAAAAVPLPSGAPRLRLAIPASDASPHPPREPFPSQGESAVAIPSLSFDEATANQQPHPIASLTKLMTAYVTLGRLPLSRGASGPSIQVEPADVVVYRGDVRTGQSSVKVVDGEVLTERQLLEGLLVPSANNFAVLLAELVAGSTSEMTLDMNEAAQQLGLRATTYADVSGFDPATQSSAADQLHLAELLMRNPTFASIVRLPSVWLPVAGDVPSFTLDIGERHLVGVKAGYTSQAGGCDVVAYDARVGDHDVLVFAVVLGQYSLTPGRSDLAAAARSAYVLAASTARHVHLWNVAVAQQAIGVIGWESNTVSVVASTTVSVPVFRTSDPRLRVIGYPWPASGVSKGRRLATMIVTSGSFRGRTDLVASATLARASLWKRLS